MGFWAFWEAVFQRAISESLTLAQTVVFCLVLLVGFLRSQRRQQALHVWVTGGRVAIVVMIGLLIVRIPVAIYALWDDEHTARLSAECKLHAISNETTKHRDLVKSGLQGFYVQAKNLQTEKITIEGLPDWVSREARFAHDLIGVRHG